MKKLIPTILSVAVVGLASSTYCYATSYYDTRESLDNMTFMYEQQKSYTDSVCRIVSNQRDLVVALNEQHENDVEVINQLEEINNDLKDESMELLEQINNLSEQSPNVLSYDFNPEEIDLLCRLVQSEAGYNNYESQKHVINVILNRIASEEFPNTITGVIYDHRWGVWQFSVVPNGMINTEARQDTIDNVKNCLLYNDFQFPKNVLYFSAEKTKMGRKTYLTCEGTTFSY